VNEPHPFWTRQSANAFLCELQGLYVIVHAAFFVGLALSQPQVEVSVLQAGYVLPLTIPHRVGCVQMPVAAAAVEL